MALIMGISDVPENKTPREADASYRARHPERRAETHRRFAEAHGTARRDSQYLAKPFCAWDGEGYDTDDGRHIYNLFSGKCGDDSISIADDSGLATVRIFETLLEFSERHPDAIHIIYGGNYDFNMWCSDMDRATIKYVYTHDFARWRNYRIKWQNRKNFYVCRVDDKGKRVGRGVTVYDVGSFFQRPFVDACDSYLGDRFIHREMIVANKAMRGKFTASDLDSVTDYNDAELDNLILLADELRLRLNKVELRPRRWDSPGAIAAALLEKHGIKKIIQESNIPEPVQEASRYAYAGGRFELIRYGHYEGNVYEYDINSAYPAALRDVPDLSKGTWKYVSGDPGPRQFAVYHIESHTDNLTIPAPLFRRGKNGTVCYPLHVTGWYWTPEYKLWTEYVDRKLSTGRVIEAWVFEPETDAKPFDFIEPLFMKRRALKKAGDGAHVGIKLALNSLYGKLAQQVGAKADEKGQWRKPPYHCLEWAGYATSHCRATIVGAVIDNLDSVIAFETDAVFTTVPLPVKNSSNLGEFDYLKLQNLTYVQSGLYFATDEDGNEIEKTRGVDRGELKRDIVMERMSARLAADRYAEAKLTRFNGAGIALQGRWDKWRRWTVETKRMTLAPTGKRDHFGCPACSPPPNVITMGVLHETMCPMMGHAHSAEFPIMWINPNPDMPLHLLREEGNDYE